MNVIEKAKLDIESEHISRIIGERRIAAGDKHTQANMERALDAIMKNPPRLERKSQLTFHALEKKNGCPMCGNHQQQGMPPGGQPPQGMQPSGDMPPMEGQPQQPVQQFDPIQMQQYVESLGEDGLQALSEIVKKKMQSIRSPIDQPEQQQQFGQGRPF